jgi:hypothetical protein
VGLRAYPWCKEERVLAAHFLHQGGYPAPGTQSKHGKQSLQNRKTGLVKKKRKVMRTLAQLQANAAIYCSLVQPIEQFFQAT